MRAKNAFLLRAEFGDGGARASVACIGFQFHPVGACRKGVIQQQIFAFRINGPGLRVSGMPSPADFGPSMGRHDF